MEDNPNKTISIMIGIFVVLIVGIAFISVIAEQEQSKVTKSTATETVNIAAARLSGQRINETYFFHLTNGCPYSTWRSDQGGGCDLQIASITNSSGGTLTETTDYVVSTTNAQCSGATAGDLNFVNNTNFVLTMSNTTTVKYTYCPNEYIGVSWGRTVANMIPGFFALALLGAALYFGVWYYNKQ